MDVCIHAASHPRMNMSKKVCHHDTGDYVVACRRSVTVIIIGTTLKRIKDPRDSPRPRLNKISIYIQ